MVKLKLTADNIFVLSIITLQSITYSPVRVRLMIKLTIVHRVENFFTGRNTVH